MKPYVALVAIALATPTETPRAQPESRTQVEGAAVVTEETRLVERIREALGEDSALREHLARRILVSSLASHLSASRDPAAAQADVDDWIQKHPQDAAQLAVGFARDDRDGTHAFEESLYSRVTRYFELNPHRYEGILGTLNAAGRESRLTLRQQKIPEEEEREILKHVFEGKGGETARVLTDSGSRGQIPPERSGTAGPSGPATFAGTGLYDRLSALNPTGYSPQVQSYQSALNTQRTPGAPHVLETGRLNYTTLVHPFYSLRFDLDRLQKEFQRSKTWELARLLGVNRGLGPKDYENPALLRELEQAAQGKTLPFRLERRRQAIERAGRALAELKQEAEKTRNPLTIAPATLRSLGARQKEAARWITIASLEADLEWLERAEAFWTDAFQEQIRSAPAAEQARQAYLGQGPKLQDRIRRIEEYDQRALDGLQSPAYLERWTEAEKLANAADWIRKNLDRDIRLFAETPGRLRAAWAPKPRWRDWLDRWIQTIAPNTAYARRTRREEAASTAWRDAFVRISTGDFSAAQKILSDTGALP